MELKVLIFCPSLHQRAQCFPDVHLLLSSGQWVGVLADPWIGEFRLVATLCSHSSTNFPKIVFFVSSCLPCPAQSLVSGMTSPVICFPWPTCLQNISYLQPGGAPFPHCFYIGAWHPWQSHRILHPQTPVKSCQVWAVHSGKRSSAQRCIAQELNSNKLCFVLGESCSSVLLADLHNACLLWPGSYWCLLCCFALPGMGPEGFNLRVMLVHGLWLLLVAHLSSSRCRETPGRTWLCGQRRRWRYAWWFPGERGWVHWAGNWFCIENFV